MQGTPVDASGAAVTGVEMEPRTVHVTIPLYTNKQSRSVPVNPVLTGTPGAGLPRRGGRGRAADRLRRGRADQLATLTAADTAPVSVYGATRT